MRNPPNRPSVSEPLGASGYERLAQRIHDVAQSPQIIASFDIKAGTEGYPPSLETLVEGVAKANDASGVKLKFLRRIPIDPITKSTEGGMRAYGDKPDSTAWGGGNVFDVYTKATGKALDGTNYRDW